MAQITEHSISFEEAQVNFHKLVECNEKYKNENFGTYKIFDNVGEFIGLSHVEEWLKEAEIGYRILPKYWSLGYGTGIAKTLIEKAKKSKLKKLKAIIDPTNIPSRKI